MKKRSTTKHKTVGFKGTLDIKLKKNNSKMKMKNKIMVIILFQTIQ